MNPLDKSATCSNPHHHAGGVRARGLLDAQDDGDDDRRDRLRGHARRRRHPRRHPAQGGGNPIRWQKFGQCVISNLVEMLLEILLTVTMSGTGFS